MFSLLLTLTASCPAVAPPLRAEAPFGRVGQIFIVGNTVTPQDTILRCLPNFFPGVQLTAQDGATATRRLAGLRLLGIRARRSIANPAHDSASAYKDIMVEVEESWLTWLLLGPRSRVDDLVGRMNSSARYVGTACFGEDSYILRNLGRDICGLFETAYAVAPTPILSTACQGSMPLVCMVRVFIGVPETLSFVAPLLGAPRK